MSGSSRHKGRRYNAPALRRPPFANRRFAAATTVLCALALGLVAASPALASYIAPESQGGSPNADNIHDLYIVVFVLGMIVFVGVEGLLVYTLVKYRWRRGGIPPAQIRGNTPLEIGWTLGAAALLVVITVVTFIFLPAIKNPPVSKPGGFVASAGSSVAPPTPAGGGRLEFASTDQQAPPGPPNKHLEIGVNGQQYLWRFTYPGKAGVFSYHDMVVPTNTTVVLNITASDVAHSWWIPKLGGKADAIPAHVNHTWFRISKPGTFWGNCAEFCGENHADMTARVIAVSPNDYKAFLTRQAAEIKQSQALLALARRTRESSQP